MNEWVDEWINQSVITLPSFLASITKSPIYQLFIHMQTKLGLTRNKPIMQMITQTSPCSSSNMVWSLWPLDLLFFYPEHSSCHLPSSIFTWPAPSHSVGLCLDRNTCEKLSLNSPVWLRGLCSIPLDLPLLSHPSTCHPGLWLSL